MKKTTILAAGLLASAYSASAALTSVLLYDADNGTGAGIPAALANGTAITDQSGAGNGGVTENGINGNGTGSVSTVEDDPFDVTGELSFSYDGSSARIISTAIDLLTDDLIAAAGGYTMSTWIKTSLTEGTRSLMGFAGTDGMNIVNGNPTFIAGRGHNLATLPTGINDGGWHQLTISFDTSADLDGTTGSTDRIHNLIGVLTATVDGVSTDLGSFGVGDFGDQLDRTISIGGHPQGFGSTEFIGLLYDPSVSLGVVPEPSAALLSLIGALGLIRRRR